MQIEQQLSTAVIAALKALYGADITAEQVQIQKTRPEFEGHLTIVVFPFLNISRKKPEDTAAEIGTWLTDNTPLVSAHNAVKGFLNLTIAPSLWRQMLADIDADPHYGLITPTAESPLVMIEYSSPTPTSPYTSATSATTSSAGLWHK